MYVFFLYYFFGWYSVNLKKLKIWAFTMHFKLSCIIILRSSYHVILLTFWIEIRYKKRKQKTKTKTKTNRNIINYLWNFVFLFFLVFLGEMDENGATKQIMWNFFDLLYRNTEKMFKISTGFNEFWTTWAAQSKWLHD